MKKGIANKITIIFIIFTFVSTGVFMPYFAKKAEADATTDVVKECIANGVMELLSSAGVLTYAGQGIGDLALELGLGDTFIGDAALSLLEGGSEVPTSDSTQHEKTQIFQVQECLNRLKDLAIKTAHNVLKKRLLDQIVDQTIQWVQDGTEPKFVSNFNELWDEAVQAGIGDTLKETALGQFCSAQSKLRIEIGIKQIPKFSEAVSCTLNDVVQNMQAFTNDFKNGSWVGLQELAAPQNNRYGVKLLAMEKILSETEKQQELKQMEISGSGGFLGQKICSQWILKNGQGNFIIDTTTQEPIYNFEERKMTDPPLLPANAPSWAYWDCDPLGVVTITPSKTVGDVTSKSVTSDIDYILSADELDEYVNAIADAILNRITTEAVSGLKNVLSGSNGSPVRGGNEGNKDMFLNDGINEASGNYKKAVGGTDINDAAENYLNSVSVSDIDSAYATIDPTIKTFNSNSSSTSDIKTENGKLILILDYTGTPRGLTQCFSSKINYNPTSTTFMTRNEATNTLTTAKATRDSGIQTSINRLNELKTIEYPKVKSDLQNAKTTTEKESAVTNARAFISETIFFRDSASKTLTNLINLQDKAKQTRTDCENF